ncbi:MAG: sigma-54-dependent Fis family transcriptional regulator [bacterium]|nr:sigma-54-dependent Fis family transcriptional regulator [bacterium]
MRDKYEILVVEDSLGAAKALCFELKNKGYNARHFDNAEEGLLFFHQNPIDVVLVDYSLPGMSGEEFFVKLRETNPMTPVIFMTALHSVSKAVQLIQMGAYTYLTKPLDMDKLLENVETLLEKIDLDEEYETMQENVAECLSPAETVFESEKMRQILRMVMRVAKFNANVLITGESGTGKDVIARLLHHCSNRKAKPLVKVNLAAIPDTLIEAELFGSAKGAYSGSIDDREGKFEAANRGTLFLDEIGELSPEVQVKLLHSIQDREITRLGTNQPRKVDIRLLTATNKNLTDLVKEKKFREDLFYRLNVIDIELPPLRERREDIPLLVNRFITKFCEKEGTTPIGISKDALDCLIKYPFPGNIRELENIIERALVLARGETLRMDDLPVFVLSREEVSPDLLEDSSNLPLPERLSIIEKNILEKTLKKHRFHQSNAAEELGISEARLRYKMRTLGLQKK